MSITVPVVSDEQLALDFVPVNEMFLDHSYQRLGEERRIQKLADNWNNLAAGVLYVAKRRNGKYAVIDGQHRWGAAKKLGIEHLPALVIEGLTIAQEAMLFVQFNRDRKAASSVEVFRASVAHGDQMAIDIERILSLHGLQVGNKTEEFRALGSARKIYERFGWEVLAAIVGTTTRAWPSDPKGAADGHIMMGIAGLYSYYGASKFDFAVMERGLHRTTRDDIALEVVSRRGRHRGMGFVNNKGILPRMAATLVDIYNDNVGRGRAAYRLPVPASPMVFAHAARRYRWDDGGLTVMKEQG